MANCKDKKNQEKKKQKKKQEKKKKKKKNIIFDDAEDRLADLLGAEIGCVVLDKLAVAVHEVEHDGVVDVVVERVAVLGGAS
jgi:ppGpp synthetase/RelA/SpoT-type nucleotidyltranferase